MPTDGAHVSDPTELHYDTDLLVAGLARRHAQRWNFRDREAVVAGDVRLTWQQLHERVERLAAALARRGIAHGDRVALFIPNRAEFFEIVLALAELGAVATPQSFRSSVDELTYGLLATGARLLITEDAGPLAERAGAAMSDDSLAPIELIGVGGVDSEYERLLAGAPSVGTHSPSETDAFWLALTGGTTGPPKLVRVPHRVLVQMWLLMVLEFDISRRDTMLIAGPLHHGLGFGFALQQLYVGGRTVVLPAFDARAVVDTIATERVTVLPAAPTMLALMLDELDAAGGDLSSLRSVISAGSPLSPAIKQRLLAAVPSLQLYEHYGATEAGFFTVLHPEDQLRKVRSCGVAFFGSAVRVLGDDGTDLPPGQIGLVYKRGLIQGGGYADHPAATAAMLRDGWATVGDLGYLDEEGYLYLVDRKSDMIVSGGVNIYPAELEAEIAGVDSVAEVAVVGLPDPTWGEVVVAFVVPRPGAVVDPDAVVAACTARLAQYKRPRRVEIVDELPKSVAGKVLKRELRAQYG